MTHDDYGTITIGRLGEEPRRIIPALEKINLKSMTVYGWGRTTKTTFHTDGTISTEVWK
jgi:hypothetical protein